MSLSVSSLLIMSTTNGIVIKKKKIILPEEKNIPIDSYESNQMNPVIWMAELLSI